RRGHVPRALARRQTCNGGEGRRRSTGVAPGMFVAGFCAGALSGPTCWCAFSLRRQRSAQALPRRLEPIPLVADEVAAWLATRVAPPTRTASVVPASVAGGRSQGRPAMTASRQTNLHVALWRRLRLVLGR